VTILETLVNFKVVPKGRKRQIEVAGEGRS
jgi:hypothetical protein